jgi:F-type H+-transporting ATPase subunit delta
VNLSKARTQALARKLANASIEGGEPSAARVDAVLRYLRQRPAGERRALLVAYLLMMRREELLRTISIERAGALDDAARAALVEGLAKRSGKKLLMAERENPALIAGLRVRLGDDLYDATLQGVLERMGAH